MNYIFSKIKRYYFIFTIVVIAFCALLVVVETINSKLWTNDFQVYFGAVNDFFSGKNPYDTNYGLDTGYFKYPPFTLYLFSLCALLPFKIAQGIHLFILIVSWITSIYLWHKMLMKYFKAESPKSYRWILYLAFAFIAIHVSRELHLGNINLILLALFTLGAWFFNINRLWLTVVFFSLMVILKPIALFIFIPMLFYKQWKIILGSIGLGAFFFLFPILTEGWSGNLTLWTDWFTAISEHGEYVISENSLTYYAQYYFGITSAWLFSIIGLIIILACIAYDRFVLDNTENAALFWSVILLSFTPNFFVTDTEHFLLSLPLIMVFIFYVRTHASFVNILLLISVFLLFSINSNDLLGREFSDVLDAYGILGLGNLLLVSSFIIIYLKKGRTRKGLTKSITD